MKTSAGILMYRIVDNKSEVLLVHPGGPFFKNKDAGAWSIPKGEIGEDEDPFATAIREFKEELGTDISGTMSALGSITQKGGKIVQCWAVEGDFDPDTIASNTFSIEWPPRSGKMKEFPEVDKAEWFEIAAAKAKINPAQIRFLDELAATLDK